MLTMTATQIKRALQANRKAGRRPASLYQIAKMRGCNRAVLTRALKEPTRYADARAYIESVLSGKGSDNEVSTGPQRVSAR